MQHFSKRGVQACGGYVGKPLDGYIDAAARQVFYEEQAF